MKQDDSSSEVSVEVAESDLQQTDTQSTTSLSEDSAQQQSLVSRTDDVQEQDVSSESLELDVKPEVTDEVISMALAALHEVADNATDVGDYLTTLFHDDVVDLRFDAHIRGYEHWQWSITLFYDVIQQHWTINESSLLPGTDALQPPAWIPWKERLEPSDISVTDVIGTPVEDARLEQGVQHVDDAQVNDTNLASCHANISCAEQISEASAVPQPKNSENSDIVEFSANGDVTALDKTSLNSPDSRNSQQNNVNADNSLSSEHNTANTQVVYENEDSQDVLGERSSHVSLTDTEQQREIIESYRLSRRRVLSALGRSQTAERWYEGQHGPKSISTQVAQGNACETCGFFVPIQGDLGQMFGVCSNKWSPDDGRVVSLDHACGEHSEIEEPAPTSLWVQTKPAFDDTHIEIIEQMNGEEPEEISVIEENINH